MIKKIYFFLSLFALSNCAYYDSWSSEYSNVAQNSFFIGVVSEVAGRAMNFGIQERVAFFGVSVASSILSGKTIESWEKCSKSLGFISSKRFDFNRYLKLSILGYVLGVGFSRVALGVFR